MYVTIMPISSMCPAIMIRGVSAKPVFLQMMLPQVVPAYLTRSVILVLMSPLLHPQTRERPRAREIS